jgi:hypothetical protein
VIRGKDIHGTRSPATAPGRRSNKSPKSS